MTAARYDSRDAQTTNPCLAACSHANYCASACGLGGQPTNPDFARTRGADGEYLTGNIPGPPFQMQVGFRLLF